MEPLDPVEPQIIISLPYGWAGTLRSILHRAEWQAVQDLAKLKQKLGSNLDVDPVGEAKRLRQHVERQLRYQERTFRA